MATRQRCRVLGKAAAKWVQRTEVLCERSASDQRIDPVETLTAEILPLAACLRWLGRRGHRVLADRKAGVWGRPPWLWGVRHRIRRVAHGRVLVIGTWNYPLFLTGAQVATSLAAGNQTFIKPAPGSEAVTAELADVLWSAGVPEASLRVLDSSVDAAQQRMRDGVELVVLTGASETGRAVMRTCAETLTPTIIEAGGCDAVLVLESADPKRVAQMLRFGLMLNSGATCIGPRRILVPSSIEAALTNAIRDAFADAQALQVHPAARQSAVDTLDLAAAAKLSCLIGSSDARSLRETGTMPATVIQGVTPEMEIAKRDVFAPIASLLRYKHIDEAVQAVNDCPYGLAASVLGDRREAERVAASLNVGAVTINDIVVPTADPRVPFGGRGHSGHGVTRGVEGLLAMTRVQTIATRRTNWLPHLQPRREGDLKMLTKVAKMLYRS